MTYLPLPTSAARAALALSFVALSGLAAAAQESPEAACLAAIGERAGGPVAQHTASQESNGTTVVQANVTGGKHFTCVANAEGQVVEVLEQSETGR